LELIRKEAGAESWAPDANLDVQAWPRLIVLAAREATDETHGSGEVEALIAAVALLLGVKDPLSIDQMMEHAQRRNESFPLSPEDARLIVGDLIDFDGDPNRAMKALLEVDSRIRVFLGLPAEPEKEYVLIKEGREKQ
jgi:hypothetical protein